MVVRDALCFLFLLFTSFMIFWYFATTANADVDDSVLQNGRYADRGVLDHACFWMRAAIDVPEGFALELRVSGG